MPLSGGFKEMEAVNKARFGTSEDVPPHRQEERPAVPERQELPATLRRRRGLQPERWALLDEKLGTRNRCGHPTGHMIGREEAVVFIESLINNIINDAMMAWTDSKP